jgi:hypothetical protein
MILLISAKEKGGLIFMVKMKDLALVKRKAVVFWLNKAPKPVRCDSCGCLCYYKDLVNVGSRFDRVMVCPNCK